MDVALRRCRDWGWRYAHANPAARVALAERITQAARRRRLITYSNLVRGVTFRLPNVCNGEPFEMDPEAWTEFDRALVGEFLGFLSCDSLQRLSCMLSAIVVKKDNGTPSPGFLNFARELGLLTSRAEIHSAAFWANEVAKVHEAFAPGSS